MVFLIGFGLLVGLFFQSFVWKVTSTYSTERIIDPPFNGDTIEIDRVYIRKQFSFFWAIKLPGTPQFVAIAI